MIGSRARLSGRSDRCLPTGRRTVTSSDRLMSVLSRFADRPWSDCVPLRRREAQQPAAGSSRCAGPWSSPRVISRPLPRGIEFQTSGEALLRSGHRPARSGGCLKMVTPSSSRSSSTAATPSPAGRSWEGGTPRGASAEDRHRCRDRRSQRRPSQDDKAKAKPDSKSQGRLEGEGRAGRRSGPAGAESPTRKPIPTACSTWSAAGLILPGQRPIAAAPRSGRTRRGPTSSRRRRPRPGVTARCTSVSRCSWRSASGPCRRRRRLNPRVYGKLQRDGYTIEKVVLETLPGFTLSGNLYRPAGKTGRVPGMLCPHGHWEDGRVNPEVQQRCIRWAKLGCVVFMYDMVGYNDSKPFTHAFLNDRLRRWGLQPGQPPDLEQHPGPRLADLACRRGPRPDRLHGRVGRRNPDVLAHGPRHRGSRSPRRW